MVHAVVGSLPHHILPISGKEVRKLDIVVVEQVTAGGTRVQVRRRVRSIGSTGIGLGPDAGTQSMPITWFLPSNPAIVGHNPTE